MSLLTRQRVVLAKIESAYGVDPTPSGSSNAILVQNLTPAPQNATLLKRAGIRPYTGNAEQLATAVHAGLDFEIEMAGSGAAGTAPLWGPLLRACGFSETINAGVDTTYVPVSSGYESATLYFNNSGVLHKITGARGTVAFDVNANQIPVMKFKFLGIYNDPADVALPAMTLSAWQRPLACNAVNTPTFSLHGVSTAVLNTLSFDMANTLTFRALIGAQEARNSDRAAVGQVSIEANPIATHDWFTAAKIGTKAALQVIHGTTAGNIIQIDAPQVQLTNPQYQDLQGIQMLQMAMSLVPTSAGNDEFSIKAK